MAAFFFFLKPNNHCQTYPYELWLVDIPFKVYNCLKNLFHLFTNRIAFNFINLFFFLLKQSNQKKTNPAKPIYLFCQISFFSPKYFSYNASYQKWYLKWITLLICKKSILFLFIFFMFYVKFAENIFFYLKLNSPLQILFMRHVLSMELEIHFLCNLFIK